MAGRSARKKVLNNEETLRSRSTITEPLGQSCPICLVEKRNDGKEGKEGRKTAFKHTNKSKAVDYKALSSRQLYFYSN